MANPQRRKRTAAPPLTKRQLKIAIYIRVSTHHQIDKDSLPFQREELTNYAKYVLGTDDIVIFEDAGYSAKNTDRPKYQEMMTRIRAGEFSHLLVWKLDRISRNLHDFGEMWDELKDCGVIFVSKMEQFDTSSAMGEAMLRIILVFAELERKLTAERVYGIMMSRANKGLWNGAPVPLGYDWDEDAKTVSVNKDEAKVVGTIYGLYQQLRSTVKVAERLVLDGMQTKRGGAWQSKTVNDILRNPVYSGTLRWNYRQGGRGKKKAADEVILQRDAVPAIVSEQVWESVQAMLNENYKGQLSQRSTDKFIHVLSGLIRCGHCGKNYVSTPNRPHAHGFVPSTYICGTKQRSRTCQNKNLTSYQVEPFILEYLRSYFKAVQGKFGDMAAILMNDLDHPEIAHIDIPTDAIASSGQPTIKDVAVSPEVDALGQLQTKKRRIEQAILKLDDAYLFSEGANVITKSEYLVKRSDLLQRVSKIDGEIHTVTAKVQNEYIRDLEEVAMYYITHQIGNAKSIREVLPFLDRQAAKDFIQQLVRSIEVTDGRVTKITFYGPHGDIEHKIIYQ